VNKEFVIPHSEIPGVSSGSITTLKSLMRAAVESHATTILPERFERVYMHWIDNLRDWCISRQIWFGHRIPAWYKEGEIKVSVESPGAGWEQDADTLDTWFSSGLWTFSTLGWPEKTEDMKRFHPTSVLETGYDIIFFWVARMVLMSAFHLGQVPFKTVYLHGLVRDAKGKKMSKSLGNIIDPVDMIEKYGADAARLSLIIGAAPGNDIKLSEDRVRGYKNFANKIWNIARFVLESTEGLDVTTKPKLDAEDTADIEELNKTITEVTKQLNDYRLDLAADATYHYIWHTFADVVIEKSKEALRGEDAEAKQRTAWKLYTILTTSLKLIHPFMPFVTEEIWTHLPEKDADMLIVASFPTVQS
jgi:valyl-tRNA synthetase